MFRGIIITRLPCSCPPWPPVVVHCWRQGIRLDGPLVCLSLAIPLLLQANHVVILFLINIDQRSISLADELIQSKQTNKKKTKDLYHFRHKRRAEFGCHACHRKCSLTFNKKSVFCFLKNGSHNVGVTNCGSFSTTCKNEHFPFIYKKTMRKYIITRGW